MVYSITGMVMGTGGPTVVRLHTNSPLAALALAQAEQSVVLVTDETGRLVSEGELIKVASKCPAGSRPSARTRTVN